MAHYDVGKVIKTLRDQRGLSQEQLSDSLIERYTISKIETGKQMPRKDTLDAIMERLGVSPEKYYGYMLSLDEFKIYEKRELLDSYLLKFETDEADRLIAELEQDSCFQQGFHMQFLLKAKAVNLMNKISVSNEDEYTSVHTPILKELVLKAIKISIKHFDEQKISSYLLTREEIRIIDVLTIVYHFEKNNQKAITILFDLIKSIESAYVDEGEKAKSLPMIMYNATKLLGLEKRYDEAIDLCDRAKKICISNDKLIFLPLIIFNKAYCMYEKGDREDYKKLVYEAYYACSLFDDYVDKELIKNHANDIFGIVFNNT